MEDFVKLFGEHPGAMVLLKDNLACKGSFMLHYLLRKLLADTTMRVILLGLSEPLTHYNRIARKQGCNLQSWRDKGRFVFVELTPEVFESSAVSVQKGTESGFRSVTNPLASLYYNIKDVAQMMQTDGGEQVCIMIDDASVLDVIGGGSQNNVLEFLHYCQALRCGNQRCSLVVLTHQDIYGDPADSCTSLELEFASDVVISIEPLSTGFSADIHGQLLMVHRVKHSLGHPSRVGPVASLHQRFQFRILENAVQIFLPGQL